MSQLYMDNKSKFDDMVYGYMVKRLTQPYTETDAFGTGHIDEHGNELRSDEDWSYTKLDRLVFDLRAAAGDNIKKVLHDDYSAVDALALMTGRLDPKDYSSRFAPVVKLVEEAGYLPESTRGQPGQPQEDPGNGMSATDRVSFALTVATALVTCLLKDRAVNAAEFDREVLPSTEATFGVRSIGSAGEVLGYLRENGLMDPRDITPAGTRLAVALAREIIKNHLARPKGGGADNKAVTWEELSRA